MLFVKKIFEGGADEVVHRKFSRFSKGEFERGLMEVRKGKDIKIKASCDLADDIFGLIADNCNGNVKIKGKIIASFDFEGEVELEKYTKGKKFTGEIDCEVSCDELRRLYDKFKMSFILLGIECDCFKLKCKKSLPRPGKKLDVKFCSAVFPLKFLNEFVWEREDFKKAEIKHTMFIDELVIPEDVSDFAEARKIAKRKGKVVREAVLDGEKIVSEKDFVI